MIITPFFRILSSETTLLSDRALGKFAEFLGLQVELILDCAGRIEPPVAFGAGLDGEGVYALNIHTLHDLAGCAWFSRILENSCFLLVYGFSTEATESAVLKKLSGGVIAGTAMLAPGDCQFTFHSDFLAKLNSLSGLSFKTASNAQPIFVEGPHYANARTHLSAAGRPYLVSLPARRGTVFLLAEAQLVDIDIALSPKTELRVWYAPLIALSIFLRGAFEAQCWTAPFNGANFIVDDPNLKSRYGFVRYRPFIDNLQRTGISLTVAFIPFNYLRSDRRTVRQLQNASDRFSISVHGCDHTGGEYASTDGEWLEGTTLCALQRMEEHRRRTGMPFDNVMVFPQGRFSIAAIDALRRCGLDAAVNTTAWPEDWAQSSVTLRDLLDVAVTRYGHFPIFVRRYPEDLFDFAFDFIFQKPLLGVEHHQYFRNGFRPLEIFAENLARLVPSLKWMPLGRTLASSHLIRCNAKGNWLLRHFVPEFRHRNFTETDLVFEVEKSEIEGSVDAVIVDGKPVPFKFDAGWLRYSVAIRAGHELNARVLYRKFPLCRRRTTWKYRTGVFVRRSLSDLRDNYVSRSKWVLRVAEVLKRTIEHRNRLGFRNHEQ